MSRTGEPTTAIDTESVGRALAADGIVGCAGAFAHSWLGQLRDDIEAAFKEAVSTAVLGSDYTIVEIASTYLSPGR